MRTRPLLSLYLQSARIAAAKPWLRGRVLDIGSSDGALARHVSSDNYVGFEPEPVVNAQARKNYPTHSFVDELPLDQFDTVALAVVEHLSEPAETVSSRVGGSRVLTTPHKSLRWAHELGARIGLSSAHTADDHETLRRSCRLPDI